MQVAREVIPGRLNVLTNCKTEIPIMSDLMRMCFIFDPNDRPLFGQLVETLDMVKVKNGQWCLH
jgi:hypothetical protein